MKQMKQWYVVYTKAGEEQRVCDALLRRRWESFYPAKKLTKNFYGRERISFQPLFERYVFVLLPEDQLEQVKQVDGILNPVYWLSSPAVIDAESIYLLKRFFTAHDNISLEKINVKPAETASLSVTSGEEQNNVHLHFPSLGYRLTAKESKTRVKVITVPNQQPKTNFSNQYAETR